MSTYYSKLEPKNGSNCISRFESMDSFSTMTLLSCITLLSCREMVQESEFRIPIVSVSKIKHGITNCIVLSRKKLLKWSHTSMHTEKNKVSVHIRVKFEFTFKRDCLFMIVTNISNILCINSTRLRCIKTSPLWDYFRAPLQRYIWCNNHVFPHLFISERLNSPKHFNHFY